MPLSTTGPTGLPSVPLQGLILVKIVNKATKKTHCYRNDFHTLMEEKKTPDLHIKKIVKEEADKKKTEQGQMGKIRQSENQWPSFSRRNVLRKKREEGGESKNSNKFRG